MSLNRKRMRVQFWDGRIQRSGGRGALFAYFQKSGLKAIESAETVSDR